jgi:hypothetical protein
MHWRHKQKGDEMKTMRLSVLVLTLLALVATDVSLATKPGEEVNPNGFPSGEHFNLNIIGKKDDFSCPPPEYDEITGEQVFGNVIFIPENNRFPIQIVMESGQKGPKSAPQTAGLEVTDWCSGFSSNDDARLRLPKNDKGYRVYGRILAKPTDLPSISITPELVSVEDENGHDLLLLGLVTDNGFSTPFAEFTRQKGKSKAIDITGLFEWSGTVCYFENPDPTDSSIWAGQTCALDVDGDGIWDEIVSPDPETLLCPIGYESVDIFCKDYTDTWVFNIAAFVEYLWGLDNNGSKLLQIRFYPVK